MYVIKNNNQYFFGKTSTELRPVEAWTSNKGHAKVFHEESDADVVRLMLPITHTAKTVPLHRA